MALCSGLGWTGSLTFRGSERAYALFLFLVQTVTAAQLPSPRWVKMRCAWCLSQKSV
jgi:hypothetical protein